MCYEEIRTKQDFLTYHSAYEVFFTTANSLNGNVFGNKCYRCNKGSLSVGAHVQRYIFSRGGSFLRRIWGQRKARSACAFAQSDQGIRCPHEVSMDTAEYNKGQLRV